MSAANTVGNAALGVSGATGAGTVAAKAGFLGWLSTNSAAIGAIVAVVALISGIAFKVYDRIVSERRHREEMQLKERASKEAALVRDEKLSEILEHLKK